MYPRNAASPPRIAVGAVVQISDGAVQGSGVSIAVRPEGGSEGAGGGTTSYGGSSSIVYYTPTQAETNYTAFVITAYKTGCIPVSVTVVTSAESTAGKVSLGSAQTADITGSLSGSVGSVTGGINTGSGTITTLDALDTAQDSQHATTQSAVSTAQDDLDILTGTNGVTLASSQPNYAPVVSSDLPANFADLNISVTTGLVSLSADQSGVTIGTVNTAAALGAQAKLDVNAECDTALADYDAVVPADLPTNFGSMVISGAGAVDSLVQGFLNNTIAETTADNIAANFEVFFDNGNAITTKVVNDVGVAGSGLTAQQVWEYDISSIVTTGQAGSELNDASAGGGASAGEIADAVLDEALSGHTTAGTLGKAIADTLADTNELQTDWANGGRLDLILDARASQSSVDVIDGIVDSILVDTATTIPATLATLATSSALATVDANVDAILVDTGTTIPAQITALSIPSAASIADAVWDESTAGHVTAGTYGAAVSDILVDTGTTIPAQVTALNNLSAADIRTAVGLASASLDTQLSTIDTNVNSVLTDTGTTLPATLATLATSSALATVDTNVDTLVAELATAYGEPADAPGVSEKLSEKVGYLYSALRNQITVTSSAKTFFNDSGTSLWSKALSDNGTTYTEAEGA